MSQGFLVVLSFIPKETGACAEALGQCTNGSAAYFLPPTLVKRLKQQKDPLITKQQKNRHLVRESYLLHIS